MAHLHRYLAQTAVNRYGALQKPEELEWLLDKLPSDLHTIVEIGCDAGGTLYLWNRIAPTVLGIDLPGGPFGTGRPLTPHGSTLILADSHDVRTYGAAMGFLYGQEADMLFLDGDHTYEGVVQDFFTYRLLVRESGAVVLQDIRDHHRNDVGVHRLWKAIKVRWPGRTEEFMSGNEDWAGIGILWNPKVKTEDEMMDPSGWNAQLQKEGAEWITQLRQEEL